MSRFTQSRRWAVQHAKHRRGQITERNITPEEARVALHACVLECGFVFEELLEYCPRRDKFQVEARNQDGKLFHLTVPGGVVETVVIAARALSGGGTDRPMRRKYELIGQLKDHIRAFGQ